MEKQAYSIDEFCQAHGFGRSTYYKLKHDGLAPAEIRVGNKPLITVESAAIWREQMQRRAQAA